MPGDGEVALLLLVIVIAVAAAAQLELGPDLVERPAVIRRNRATWHPYIYVDAQRVAALPVAQFELRLQISWQDVGQVEVFSVSDGREAEVEAPVGADAPPQLALELDAEADCEGLFAFDDGVLRVLVIIEYIGVPVCPQVLF